MAAGAMMTEVRVTAAMADCRRSAGLRSPPRRHRHSTAPNARPQDTKAPSSRSCAFHVLVRRHAGASARRGSARPTDFREVPRGIPEVSAPRIPPPTRRRAEAGCSTWGGARPGEAGILRRNAWTVAATQAAMRRGDAHGWLHAPRRRGSSALPRRSRRRARAVAAVSGASATGGRGPRAGYIVLAAQWRRALRWREHRGKESKEHRFAAARTAMLLRGVV